MLGRLSIPKKYVLQWFFPDTTGRKKARFPFQGRAFWTSPDCAGFTTGRRPDSNRHELPHRHLKPTCLPIPPLRQSLFSQIKQQLLLALRRGLGSGSAEGNGIGVLCGSAMGAIPFMTEPSPTLVDIYAREMEVSMKTTAA